jgi:hypothetical protein
VGAALQADGENEVRIFGLKHQKEKRSMDHFGLGCTELVGNCACPGPNFGRLVAERVAKRGGQHRQIARDIRNGMLSIPRPLRESLLAFLADI